MLPIPTRFFVTSGRAASKVSDLNAFDAALTDAGLSEQNLVYVSSVLPVNIRQVKWQELPMGAITHCVLAQQRGGEGEMISAGIAFGFRDDGRGGDVAGGGMKGTGRAPPAGGGGEMGGVAQRPRGKVREIRGK